MIQNIHDDKLCTSKKTQVAFKLVLQITMEILNGNKLAIVQPQTAQTIAALFLVDDRQYFHISVYGIL